MAGGTLSVAGAGEYSAPTSLRIIRRLMASHRYAAPGRHPEPSQLLLSLQRALAGVVHRSSARPRLSWILVLSSFA